MTEAKTKSLRTINLLGRGTWAIAIAILIRKHRHAISSLHTCWATCIVLLIYIITISGKTPTIFK